jgi:hypothetical protein
MTNVIKARKKNISLLLLFIGMFFLMSLQGTHSVKAQGQGYVSLIAGIGVVNEQVIVDIPYRVHVKDNWSDVRSTYDWCKGEGTLLDPYLVQNIRINSSLQGTGFFIENAYDYFVIRNCIFEDSGRNHEHDAGVRVRNVTNGLITNCNFIYNQHGVNIYESSNITVMLSAMIGSFNDVLTGWGKSIYIWKSYNITTRRNFAYNYYDGFCTWRSIGVEVLDNIIANEHYTFTYIPQTAIYFSRTNYSAIVNNTVFGTSPTPISSSIRTSQDDTPGIQLVDSYFNTVDGNRYFNINDSPTQDGNDNEITIPGYNAFILIISIGYVVAFLVRRKGQININS